MKLKITKDKIVLKEYKEDENFDNLFKMTGIESTIKAGKDIASFVKASVTLIYKSFGSLLYNILNEDGDMTKFAKRMQDLDKEYITDTNTAIQSLDNTTRNMILSAGLKESEIDMIFAAGMPAGALAERLQNKAYRAPKPKVDDYKPGEDPYVTITKFLYTTYLGESAESEISYASNVAEVIKNTIREKMSPQVVEWINGLTDLNEKDKKIINRILKLSFVKDPVNIELTTKVSNKLSADIRSIIDSLIESFHVLKITKNNTSLSLLNELTEQDRAKIASDVGKILNAIAACIVFEKKIIEVFFSNLNTISSNQNDKIKKDFSKVCLLIIFYKSYLDLIDTHKDNPDNFKIESYANSLQKSIPSGFEEHADKSALESLKGFKIDPVKTEGDDSNKALFIGACKSISKLLKQDFNEYENLIKGFYSRIEKFVVEDAMSMGEDKSTQISESKSDLVYLYSFLKQEVSNITFKDDISAIDGLIAELTPEEEEEEPETESSSDSEESSTDTQGSGDSESNQSQSA